MRDRKMAEYRFITLGVKILGQMMLMLLTLGQLIHK